LDGKAINHPGGIQRFLKRGPQQNRSVLCDEGMMRNKNNVAKKLAKPLHPLCTPLSLSYYAKNFEYV